MVELAAQIYRDFNTDGDPGSGPHKPLKSEIRAWGTDVEDRLTGVEGDLSDYLPLAGGTMTGILTTNGRVKFPATQSASADANTLDDYEEGTWTPAFSATGCTFNYASQLGTYTKIGNRCLIDFRLEIAATGNTLAANALSITGLPFASATTLTLGFPIAWSATTSSYVSMIVLLASASSALAIAGATAAATTNTLALNASSALHATNGSTLRGGFQYRTA